VWHHAKLVINIAEIRKHNVGELFQHRSIHITKA